MVDIGDDQSLDNDLSTYSSFLVNMKDMMAQADSDTLVLIDEFGSGTEPAAGGAIAEALLAKGAQLGVVLSFMMGVTTLSLPSMIMLRKAVKPKLLGLFIGICTIGIVIVGYFFNAIQLLLV